MGPCVRGRAHGEAGVVNSEAGHQQALRGLCQPPNMRSSGEGPARSCDERVAANSSAARLARVWDLKKKKTEIWIFREIYQVFIFED